MPETGFKGYRALVTGGGKGIGAAIVRQLAANDAKVVILDRDEEATRALAAETGADPLIVDLTDTQKVIAEIQAAGAFDILINNAGVDQHSFFTKSQPDEWRYLLNINLQAVLATTYAVLPRMQAKGFGRIVNVSSEAGRKGSKGGAVYAAAKAGVEGFTRSIAKENARYGITANVVLPGPIDTPLLRQAVEAGGEKLLEAMKSSTLLGRLGTADEVAAAVVFLASPAAGFVTGESLGVSGGMAIL